MTEDKYEYMLHVWGGFYNEEYSKEHEYKEGYYFFDTKEQRSKYVAELKKLGAYEKGFVSVEEEGPHVRYRTIAKMELIYANKNYPIEYDFGYAFDASAAEYMFEDGNYSCDCNRSIFIRKKFGNIIEEQNCGHQIEMRNFKIEFVKR